MVLAGPIVELAPGAEPHAAGTHIDLLYVGARRERIEMGCPYATRVNIVRQTSCACHRTELDVEVLGATEGLQITQQLRRRLPVGERIGERCGATHQG